MLLTDAFRPRAGDERGPAVCWRSSESCGGGVERQEGDVPSVALLMPSVNNCWMDGSQRAVRYIDALSTPPKKSVTLSTSSAVFLRRRCVCCFVINATRDRRDCEAWERRSEGDGTKEKGLLRFPPIFNSPYGGECLGLVFRPFFFTIVVGIFVVLLSSTNWD